MALQEHPEVITILDNIEEEEDDWPELGPVNLQEAKKYMDCINDKFDTMAEMLHSDNKDTLPKCIRAFKKWIVKDWHSMTNANPEVVIRLIYDPTCIYLCQHITKGGIDIVIPDEEPPSGKDLVRKLLEKRWKQEQLELIVGIFNSACEAHSHLATVTANFSSLAKVTDQETLKLIMKSAVWPLIQMNVPEGFLDPIKDKEPQTLEQELAEKIEKTILPRHKSVCFKHELKNGPMRILAVTVWLKPKRKYFSTGMVKEACELFQVRVKQLSRVLTGHKYLGGKKTSAQKEWGKKRKDAPPADTAKGIKKSRDDKDKPPK